MNETEGLEIEEEARARANARTQVFPKPPKMTLFEIMTVNPGMVLKVMAEWVAIFLLISFGLEIFFLLVLGAYSLVKIVP